MTSKNYLKVKSQLIHVAMPEDDFKEAKGLCEKFFGKRYFSQFVREAIERYVEFFKSYEDEKEPKRVYCDLDEKVYESLINYCEGNTELQNGEVIAQLLSEKLCEMGVVKNGYSIPKMKNLVF